MKKTYLYDLGELILNLKEKSEILNDLEVAIR